MEGKISVGIKILSLLFIIIGIFNLGHLVSDLCTGYKFYEISIYLILRATLFPMLLLLSGCGMWLKKEWGRKLLLTYSFGTILVYFIDWFLISFGIGPVKHLVVEVIPIKGLLCVVILFVIARPKVKEQFR